MSLDLAFKIFTAIAGAAAAIFSGLNLYLTARKPGLVLKYSDELANGKTFWLPNDEEYELPLVIYNSSKKPPTTAKPYSKNKLDKVEIYKPPGSKSWWFIISKFFII